MSEGRDRGQSALERCNKRDGGALGIVWDDSGRLIETVKIFSTLTFRKG